MKKYYLVNFKNNRSIVLPNDIVTSINEFKINTIIDKINEGTSGYWPGYADDTTADYIGGSIMIELNDIIEKRLDKIHDKMIDKDDDVEKQFWSKHGWVNIALTLLQMGFSLNEKHVNLCKEYLKWNLEHIDDAGFEDSFSPESKALYNDTITYTLNKLDDIDGYCPGFLDDHDEGVKLIDKRHDELQKQLYKDHDITSKNIVKENKKNKMITSILEFQHNMYQDMLKIGNVSKNIHIELDIEHGLHSLERQRRNDKDFISNQDIKDTINASTEQLVEALIQDKLNMGDRVLVTRKSDHLNVVGGIGLKGDEILFKVITVMRDPNFRNIKNTFQITV